MLSGAFDRSPQVHRRDHLGAILRHGSYDLCPTVALITHHHRWLGAGQILDLVTGLGGHMTVIDVVLMIEGANEEDKTFKTQVFDKCHR